MGLTITFGCLVSAQSGLVRVVSHLLWSVTRVVFKVCHGDLSYIKMISYVDGLLSCFCFISMVSHVIFFIGVVGL